MKAKSKEELRNDLLSHFNCLVNYWSNVEGSDKYKLEGLLHSLLTTFDGCSGGFPCAIDLILRPHPDDKQYSISEEEDWIEDGTILNDDVMLHEILASVEANKLGV